MWSFRRVVSCLWKKEIDYLDDKGWLETGEGDLADALSIKIQVVPNLLILVDLGAELPTATLTVELPVFVGDNFQEKDASLKFIVEVLQRNTTPSNAGSNVKSFNEFDSKIDFSYGDV